MINNVFTVINLGQDGTDTSVVCTVSNIELAERINQGQGAMGQGPGKIDQVKCFSSFDELPQEIQTHILKEEQSIKIKRESELLEFTKNLSSEDKKFLKQILK